MVTQTGAGAPRWTDAFLDAQRRVGDPLADAIVEAVFAAGQVDAVNDVLRTLVRNDQPPPGGLPRPVQQYFAQPLPLPSWADPALLSKGEDLFQQWGVPICMILLCDALPTQYAGAKGVHVLYLTARMETDLKRRVIETAQMVVEVMARGGLAADGQGVRTLQKVRLMHAAIRHLIRARGAADPTIWDDNWGTPINQEDVAGVMLVLTWGTINALAKLDVRIAPNDAEAYLHCWKIAAHLLGLVDDLQPANMAEAEQLALTIERRQFGASKEGEALTGALVELMEGLVPDPVFKGVPAAMTRYLVGDETARMVGLHLPAKERWQFGLILRLAHLLSRGEDDHRRMARLAEPFGRALLANSPLVDRGGYRAPFQIPTELAQRWRIGEPQIVTARKLLFDQVAQAAGGPPTGRPWTAGHRWKDVLFAHWPVATEALRAVLPRALEPDTYEGSGWVSAVAMGVDHAHFRDCPALPNLRLPLETHLSTFVELHLRTYVRAGDRPGLYLFSVDVSNFIAKELARAVFHLATYHSDVKQQVSGERVTVQLVRTRQDMPDITLTAHYQPAGDALRVAQGSLDAFLHERTVIFLVDGDEGVSASERRHTPWALQPAIGELTAGSLGDATGIRLPDSAPLLRYVRESDVLDWSPQRLATV